MDNIKDYDDDGFELSFEDGTSTEERKFYVQTFTNVNMAADQKNHCTCCNTHIGTAPSAEKIVCMHPVLRVTQCVKCYRFYNSGEFDKGEDGSELYCRWCGQGGDVYCCSDCPYVFCKKCILQNLSKSALNEVTSNDNWKCYSCAPAILYPLRARHWALTNFIQKQKKKIDQMVTRGNCDQDAIADAMIRDVSVCCKNKFNVFSKNSTSQKRKRNASASESEEESDKSSTSSQRNRKKKMSRKNVESSNSDAESIDSERSKSKGKRPQKTKPIDLLPKNVLPKSTSSVTIPATVMLQSLVESSLVKSSTECNDVASLPSTDIDCTPDLFAYLVNHGMEQMGSNSNITPEQPTSSTHSLSPPSHSSPLVIHSGSGSRPKTTVAQPTITGPIARKTNPQTPQSTAISGNSIFHNYNGYRIDLQNAARQSTVRLPNGKIIHVKKQTPLSRPDPTSTVLRTPTQTVRVTVPQNIRPQIVQPVRATAPRRGRPFGPGPQHITQPHRPYIRPSMLQGPRQPPYTIQNSGPNNMYAIPFQASTGQIYPNQMQMNNSNNHLQTNQNPVLSAPRTYTNDKIGRARTQLEQQIFNAISICHQIDGKLKTLMNSNAYKNVTKLNDIKELYIHLSYLFTYTNGRFKTLQEKCMDDMRRLGFKSFANSLSCGNVIDKYGSDADEDELEIVEPLHQTISLDSDDEQSTSPHKKSPDASKTDSNVTNAANQHPVQPTLNTQLLAQTNTLNNFNVSEEEAMTQIEIDTSTEHVECDVDIMALLQPQIMFDEDENIESLLTRMDDEIEIGTPPLSEETDAGNIDKISDLKLKSKATVRLSRAETEFPEIFKKLNEIDKAIETENDQPLEADSSDDIIVIGEANSDDRPASNLDQNSLEISSSVHEDNVDGVKTSKEADTSPEENDHVAGSQIDKNINGSELPKEVDNSAEEENHVDGNQTEMIPENEEQSAIASIEIGVENKQSCGMEGKSSTTETSKELGGPVDDTIDENRTKYDAHSSVEITTTVKSTENKAQDSNEQSIENQSKENEMEIIEKTNGERTAKGMQENEVEATAPISENEVNEESAYENDTRESSKFVDASNGDFDNISSPDTFNEMAQIEKSDNSPYTDNLDFSGALDTTNS